MAQPRQLQGRSSVNQIPIRPDWSSRRKFCFMTSVLRRLSLLLLICAPSNIVAQIDIEEAPISYSDTPDENRVSQLIEGYHSGDVLLDYRRGTGYLRSVLKELDIHASTQTLVFSKTSLQVRHISSRNPRAIYFNDDTYVGWVRGSGLIEISTADPKLGAAFYKATMSPDAVAIRRANYECLGCHATSMTRGVPGHMVRSVFASPNGEVDPRKKSFLSTHESPLSERWGGWYVTGLHGDTKHMGNAFVRGGELDTSNSGNVKSLRDQIQTFAFLSPGSDIVALMVLEHQTQMHNAYNKANFKVRIAEHDFASSSERTPADDSERKAIIKQAALDVVEDLLFQGETRLTAPIEGSRLFQHQFARLGPEDDKMRSLRRFDLKTRLFHYPCSYTIYSTAFDSLQPSLKLAISEELKSVLLSPKPRADFDYLEDDLRASLAEILIATKPELCKSWDQPATPRN